MVVAEQDGASILRPPLRSPGPVEGAVRLAAYLFPADLCYSERATEVTTVLGSCVAVTVWSPSRRSGAIFHALLPEAPRDVGSGEVLRYVDSSLREILRRFDVAEGKGTGDLVFKAFGGASVGPNLPGERPLSMAVGRRNVEVLHREVERWGIGLAAYDLGGTHGRKLRFLTDSGDVFVKRLENRAQAPR